MGKILDFNKAKLKKDKEAYDEANEPHEWGIAFCWNCRREWQAVSPESANKDELECPDCGSQDSKFLNGIETHYYLGQAVEAMKEAEKNSKINIKTELKDDE